MLELINLKKTISGGDQKEWTIIKLPSLLLGAGEEMLLTGPSGSGKTTLLHMIAGLVSPSSGEIHFDGVRIDQLPQRQRDAWRAQYVGYIFQRLNLLEGMSVLENVMMAAAFAGRQDWTQVKLAARQLLARVGLAEKASLRPGKLSLGEQQRVAAARAVLNRPALLLADEPTASLDQENAAMILKLLRTLCAAQHTALLISTHDPGVMAEFARCYDLREGRLLA